MTSDLCSCCDCCGCDCEAYEPPPKVQGCQTKAQHEHSEFLKQLWGPRIEASLKNSLIFGDTV